MPVPQWDSPYQKHRTHHHFAQVVKFNPWQIRHEIKTVEGFNAKVAVLITGAVGTMACAYLFAGIALISLPAAVTSGSVIVIVAWVAQTFLQLVLLAIILVGQRVQSAASDVRAEKQFADTEALLNAMDLKTEGGLRTVLDAVQALSPSSSTVPASVRFTGPPPTA